MSLAVYISILFSQKNRIIGKANQLFRMDMSISSSVVVSPLNGDFTESTSVFFSNDLRKRAEEISNRPVSS